MDALSVMNRRRAHAVFLHDIEGYALHEISELTGVSLAAAQSRLVRGRRELLKRLDKEEKQRRPGRGIASAGPGASTAPAGAAFATPPLSYAGGDVDDDTDDQDDGDGALGGGWKP
jgi:hypothetical protein